MKSLFLFPYCFLPMITGAKVEAWKVLNVLQLLGDCTVFSASTKPVGTGWGLDAREELRLRGFELLLREDVQKRKNIQQIAGIIYAGICKIAGFEKAFGHTNPYHRYAFPSRQWYSLTKQYDIAVINYSYWARLPTACPKIVILHDLLSVTMLGDIEKEIADLRTADLVVVISHEEEQKLRQCGIKNTLWSPPAVERMDFELTDSIGMIGSENRFNLEGLQWLSSGEPSSTPLIQVFGDVSQHAKAGFLKSRGRYHHVMDPYRECGVILVPTSQGTGVQIKTVEALAAGCALVVRRGGLRGIPHSTDAWIEVDTPDEMLKVANRISKNVAEREQLGKAAHSYYEKHLNANSIKCKLKTAIQKVKNSTNNKVGFVDSQ